MATTQIGSVSMRYGNADNIDNNLNYLFDKELVLEVTTTSEDSSTKYSYKLYQIVDEKDEKNQIIKRKLEIPLSSNVIEYLNTNKENFIKGSSSEFDAEQNVFTIGTSTTFEEKEKENQFVITSYFPINPETLDVIDNTGSKILSLKNISPSSNTVIDETTTTKLNTNNYNVGIDQYGRIVSMEKRENGPQSLDEATNFSALKMKIKEVDITEGTIHIGPKEIKETDYDFPIIYKINIWSEDDLNILQSIQIHSVSTTQDTNLISYNINTFGYIYFYTPYLNPDAGNNGFNINKKIGVRTFNNKQELITISYIYPEGLYQYNYINDQLLISKLDIKNINNGYSYNHQYPAEVLDTLDHKLIFFNNDSKISDYTEVNAVDIISNKYNFALKKVLSKTETTVPALISDIWLNSQSLYNLKIHYSILIKFYKSDGNILKHISQVGDISLGCDTYDIINNKINNNIFGIKKDIFKSNNFIGENTPNISLSKNADYVLTISYQEPAILTDTDTWDTAEIIFSGTIEGLNETRFIPVLENRFDKYGVQYV